MFFRSFKNLKINKLSLCSFILINSCTSTQTLNAVNINPNKSYLDTLKVTRLKKPEIKITINQDKSFDKKAFSDAILPKKKQDISLYRVFISKNQLNPFNQGDMVSSVKDVIPNSNFQGTTTFTGISDGGPLYAFVSAYEKIITNENGIPKENFVNVTKINSSLQSIDKKWAVSENNVSILLGKNTFSDNSNSLKITLNLQAGVGAKFENSIKIFSGDPSDNPKID